MATVNVPWVLIVEVVIEVLYVVIWKVVRPEVVVVRKQQVVSTGVVQVDGRGVVVQAI